MNHSVHCDARDAKRSAKNHAIILFDGVCNLCNASVNFIIDRDPAGYFRFASQQSAAGRRLLQEYEITNRAMQTLVLVESGRCYFRSEAALRIARRLRGWGGLAAAAAAIPAFARDLAYDVIARYRYRWFGRLPACRLPSPEIAWRFLQDRNCEN